MTHTWTGTVHFMTGKRWEGPFAVTVDSGSAPVAAKRAVMAARHHLTRPRVRIHEIRLSLQRIPTPTATPEGRG